MPGFHAYKLYHSEVRAGVDSYLADEFRILGVFSSEIAAHRAIRVARTLPGFSRWPGGFECYGKILNGIDIMSPLRTSFPPAPVPIIRAGMTVYDVTSLRLEAGETFDTYRDDLCPLGIGTFTSRELAEAAVALLRGDPYLGEWPDGFRITEFELDRPAYPDGYGGPPRRAP